MRAMTRAFFRLATSRPWVVLVLVAVSAGAVHGAAIGKRSAGPGWNAGAQAGRLPNILFILSDDQRADTIGAWGNPYVRTPSLDRLAAAGASFTHAYIMGSTQAAVCAPSRAMLMTSLRLQKAREDLEGQTTWPERFAAAGYRTFITGKWHNGAASAERAFETGRSVFLGGMADPYRLPVRDFSRGGAEPVTREGGKHDSALFADEAVAFLEAQKGDRPFLCYVAFKAPHDPRVAPAVWHERFRASPPPAPANFLPQHPFDNGEMAIRDELLLPWPRTETAVQRELADYYASIGHLDEQIGRILATLRSSGLEENTLVVFSSDNGLAIGSHGLMGKQNLYEHSVRVPLLLAGPGVPRGLRSDMLCYLQDVFPTLADLAGVATIDGTDGRSLRPLLDDPAAPFRATIFTAYRHVQRAVRDSRFKLIRYPQADRTQLFDLRADPLEREDLAARPDQSATLARMRALLDQSRAAFGDVEPLTVAAPKSGSWSPPQPSQVAAGKDAAAPRQPNILLAIADDWSFPHAGAYGDTTVRTPNFDRIAREGARFTQAFVAAPSCTPSRAALLTGQAVHRLEEGGNLHGFLPKSYPVYPDLLEDAGYVVGYTGKGWGPGRFEPGGRNRNPAGPAFESFDEFMQKREPGRPFCFWFGSQDPHRPYEPGTGAQAGMTPERVRVPRFLPDTADVRQDLLDYYFEVQRFDRDLGHMIEALERSGELDHTIVIVTSDNGMPFPRAKASVYDGGVRVPLAIRWPGVAGAGRQIDALVSLTDLAPTMLEGAGLKPIASMTGRSLLPLLRGQPQPGRDRVFVERERHANVRRGDLSYPIRAIRTRDYLYIRNFRPDRWPAGDPELYVAVGPFGDIDGGPTKSVLLDRRGDPAIAPLFQLATAKRPAEELYDLRRDPEQVENVAGRPQYRDAQRRLRADLDAWLRETGDPRMIADDDRWDRFPYYGQPAK